MKTIVVPTDFSAISLNAVNYAAELAIVTGTRLMLMHVCMTPVAVNEMIVPAFSVIDLVTAAEERMQMLKVLYTLQVRVPMGTIQHCQR